jgi:hypothetical protein
MLAIVCTAHALWSCSCTGHPPPPPWLRCRGRYSGILSAVGIGLAEVVHEAQEPCATRLHGAALPELEQRLAALQGQAVAALQEQGFTEGQLQVGAHACLLLGSVWSALLVMTCMGLGWLHCFVMIMTPMRLVWARAGPMGASIIHRSTLHLGNS